MLWVKRRCIHLGYFNEEIEAVLACDRALVNYGLSEFGVFNFPDRKNNGGE